VQRIRRGQVIRARYLQQFEDVAEAVAGRLRRPRQAGAPLEAEQINSSVGTVWVEIGRIEQTVRVTNPDDDEQYVDVARMVTVTLRSPSGETQTLAFNNRT
jgi:hypothetical protein